MAGEKSDRIKSLNQSETEVLHYLFRDPDFKVIEVARELFRGEGGIRTNLTAIYDKLEVPDDVDNKREWVVREYSEAYQYVFHREEWEAQRASQRVAGEPEIFIKPPDPIVVEDSEAQLPSEPAPQQGTNCLGMLLNVLVIFGQISVALMIVLVFVFLGFMVGVHIEHYNPNFLDAFGGYFQ